MVPISMCTVLDLYVGDLHGNEEPFERYMQILQWREDSCTSLPLRDLGGENPALIGQELTYL